MSEVDFTPIRDLRYRGSRYPGFVGGTVARSTGLGTYSTAGGGGTASGLNAGGASGTSSSPTNLAAQTFDIPKVEAPGLGIKDAGRMALGMGANYAGTEIGKTAGAAMAEGASFGDAVGKGVSDLGSKVSGLFREGSSGAASSASSGGTGAASPSFGEGSSGAASSASSGGTGAASPSFGEGLTASANIGAGLGAGLATTAVGLITGQKPGEALKSGAGVGVGTWLGLAATGGNPVGGIVGSIIGSIFCFAGGAPISMSDGTVKRVEELEIGDETLLGGTVYGTGRTLAEGGIYSYRGRLVTGSHAVFETGKWMRVHDSPLAVAETLERPILVYPIATRHHLLVCDGWVSADFEEVDDGMGMTDDDRLRALRGNHERNTWIAQAIGLPRDGDDALRVDDYERRHFGTIQSWFVAHDWDPVRESILPATGAVAFAGEHAVAAAFIYYSETGRLAFIAYPVANPDTPPLLRTKAIQAVIRRLSSLAEERLKDGGVMMAMTRHRGLGSVYLRTGWSTGERGTTSYVRAVGGVDLDFMMEDRT